jgi:hypothetical protein
MKSVLMLVFALVPFLLRAQDFSVSLIPDSLKKNADAVARLEEKIYEIKSPGKAIEHERHVFTILSEAGDHIARYKTGYDKFTSINSISCKLYNEKGKMLKHVKKSDMEDVSGTGDESLMTDTRYKINDFYYRSYPYTVDYEEEDEINGILNIDDWQPQGPTEFSVQVNRYVIIAPKNYNLRYKAVNCSIQPVITETADKKIYTWEIKNLPARIDEPLADYSSSLGPFVMIAPSQI